MNPSVTTTRDADLRLWILAGALFVAYLCVAIALPTVPVFVTGRLGLNAALAGLGVGAGFFATLASRGFAGAMADRRGAKPVVACGLACYIGGALASGLAGFSGFSPAFAFLVLLVGRLLIGLGESFVAVGVISWGIMLLGPQRSGRVLAIIGATIYGALALGGPIGLALSDRFGFTGAMTASAVLPAIALVACWTLPAIAPPPAADRPPFRRVVGRIWRHGLVVCLQGVGFASIGAFFAISFLERGWSHAGFGLTAFGAGFVLVRLLFGHLPDRIGGFPVAIGSLAVELVGQIAIWAAPDPTTALIGAFLTGLGCSMVYPAMGREVVRIIEPHLRGAALGGYSAFQDLAYAITGPLAGLLADRAGYSAVFLIGAVSAALGLALALRLRSS